MEKQTYVCRHVYHITDFCLTLLLVPLIMVYLTILIASVLIARNGEESMKAPTVRQMLLAQASFP